MLPLFTTGQVKDGIDTGDLMLDLSDYMKKKDAATKTELETLTAIVANKLDAEPQHKHHMEDIKDLNEELQSKYDKGTKYSYNVILSDSEKIPYLENPKIKTMEISTSRDANGYRFYVDSNSNDLMITLNDVLIGYYSKSSGKWSFETDTSGIESTLTNQSQTIKSLSNSMSKNTSDISTMDTKINSLDSRVEDNENVLANHYEALDAVCNATLTNISDIKRNTNAITACGDVINENMTKINSVETIINSYIEKTDAVLKNHYDALLLLCQKHGMVDSNTNDGDNISPN